MAEQSPDVTKNNNNQTASSAIEPASPSSAASPSSPARPRVGSGASARLRSASLKFIDSNVPVGFMSATGDAAGRAPSLTDIRRGSYGSRRASNSSNNTPTSPTRNSAQLGLGAGPSTGAGITTGADRTKGESSQVMTNQKSTIRERNEEDRISAEDDGFPDIIFGRGRMTDQSYVPKNASKINNPINLDNEADLDGAGSDEDELVPRPKRKSKNLKAMFGESPQNSVSAPVPSAAQTSPEKAGDPVPNDDGVYPNGYSFPPKKTWAQATAIGLKGFLKFTFTPMGFLIVLYGLNVVAWGGMLFLLLCNASPAMCWLENGTFNCDDINSPRRVWVEIDSQILNALFCVTGFGLAPWRFRDLWFWGKWRLGKNQHGLRRLAGFYPGWIRLPGSDQLPVKGERPTEETGANNPALPIPVRKTPNSPLTGARAPPTKLWKIDYFVWMFIWNTLFQIALSAFMWRLNRYDRPSWSTGLFVGLAMVVAMAGGICQFRETQRIKKIEGIKWDDGETPGDVEQQRLSQQDIQTEKVQGGKMKRMLNKAFG